MCANLPCTFSEVVNETVMPTLVLSYVRRQEEIIRNELLH